MLGWAGAEGVAACKKAEKLHASMCWQHCFTARPSLRAGGPLAMRHGMVTCASRPRNSQKPFPREHCQQILRSHLSQQVSCGHVHGMTTRMQVTAVQPVRSPDHAVPERRSCACASPAAALPCALHRSASRPSPPPALQMAACSLIARAAAASYSLPSIPCTCVGRHAVTLLSGLIITTQHVVPITCHENNAARLAEGVRSATGMDRACCMGSMHARSTRSQMPDRGMPW